MMFKWKNINKNKYIFILIIVLLFLIYVSLLLRDIQKQKYGHFVKGANLKYSHYQGYNNVFRLDNNNIFILGENGIPSELYDIKTNTVQEIHFPDNLFYRSDGILLDNNRLLLSNAHIINENDYRKSEIIPYGYIVIINLNNMIIEKIIQKQKNAEKGLTTAYLLNNNRVLLHRYNQIEIVDITNGTTRILKNVQIPNLFKIIPIEENKVLIFANANLESKSAICDSIYELDILTENLKKINEITPREFPLIKKISDKEIVILGSYLKKDNNKIIEIYDIKKNKIQVAANTVLNRCTFNNRLNVEKFVENKLLIIGGSCDISTLPSFEKQSKQSEILNLDTHEIILGPKSPYYIVGATTIKLKNGNIFITNSRGSELSKKVQIFKKGVVNYGK